MFVSPSRQITLNSALQRAFKAFQQCLLDNQGINSNLIHRRNNAVTVDDEVKFKKNQFSKQTGYTLNISISDDGQKTTISNSFLIRPTYQISHFGKTQPSVDLVFKSSLMN